MFRSRTEPHICFFTEISAVSTKLNSMEGYWIGVFSFGACYHIASVFLQSCLRVLTDSSRPVLGCVQIPGWLSALNRSNWLAKEVGKNTPSLVFIDFIPLTELSLGYHGSKQAWEEKKHKCWNQILAEKLYDHQTWVLNCFFIWPNVRFMNDRYIFIIWIP